MIWSFVFLVAWLGLFLISLGGVFIGISPSYLMTVINYEYFRILILGISIFYFILFMKKVSNIFEEKEEKAYIVKNEQGTIGMTLSSIEHILKEIVKIRDFVKDVKTKIMIEKEGISVKIKISILTIENLNIEIEKMQLQLKEYIEKMLGISVKEIDVVVVKVYEMKKTNNLMEEVE